MTRRSWFSLILIGLISLSTPLISSAAPKQKVLTVWWIDSCHWCTKMEETLKDPKVVKALTDYEIVHVKGGGQPGYPTFGVGPRVHTGYLSPEDFLRWLSRVPR